jgi:hypothetical protein
VIQPFRDTNVGSLEGGTTNVGLIAGGITGGLAVASGGLLAFRLITRPKPQQDEGAKLESQPLV